MLYKLIYKIRLTDKFLNALAACDCNSTSFDLAASIIGVKPSNLPISVSLKSFTAKLAKAAIASILTLLLGYLAASINGSKPPHLAIFSLLSSILILNIYY